MAQRTFLQLAQRLALECQETQTGLVTVVGQTGRLGRICQAIASAWEDIQASHQDWQFMRRSTSWPTVHGQALYTPAQCGVPSAHPVGQWIRHSFRAYKTASGLRSEIRLNYLEYEVWRDTYLIGAMREATGFPMVVTLAPGNSVGLGLAPTDGYTVIGEYYHAPIVLTQDDDVPGLPPQHDSLIIVYRAMMLYGPHLGAPDLYELGRMEYLVRLDRLKSDQLPALEFA